MVKQKRQNSKVNLFFFVLIFFAFLTITQPSLKVSAKENTDPSEAIILGGHVKEKIEYSKDGSPNYTAVGDTVTVKVTFEKLDDGMLPDAYKQTSALLLFPDQSQGLKLKNEPTLDYSNSLSVDTKGNFVSTNKELYQQLLMIFNWEAQSLYKEPITYDGRFTEIPIDKEYDDGPYEDAYSLYRLLVNKGDKMELAYQASVTKEALKNDHFTLRTALYDSQEGDFDWNAFLAVTMPSIQNLALHFDADLKNKTVEIQNGQPNLLNLTGTWSGVKDAISSVLTVNGADVSIPSDCFKEDGTFLIPLDVTQLSQTQNNLIQLTISDSSGQVAQDDAVITVVKKAVPPELKLSAELSKPVTVYPADKTLMISGQWKDEDSDRVNLYCKINGQEQKLQENSENTKKNDWNEFKQLIALDHLNRGNNQVEVYAKDQDGQYSASSKFVLELKEGTVKFKYVTPQMEFSNSVISGTTIQSEVDSPFEVTIEDTTGKTDDWNLVVTQTTPFSDHTKNLPADLIYQREDQQVLVTSAGSTLPVKQNSTTDYSLVQDSTHHFFLAIYPGGYTGDYQTELEWSIVKAP